MRTNTTSHWEFKFDDGETTFEKCRDSFGGFVNMIRRIEAQYGDTFHHDGENFTIGNRNGQYSQVQTF